MRAYEKVNDTSKMLRVSHRIKCWILLVLSGLTIQIDRTLNDIYK